MHIFPETMEVEASPEQSSPKAVLSVAGLDPSSGAGFTADLKVFAAHRLYGLSCPTALTVQSTQGVRHIEAVRAELVAETLDCLAMDIPIAGIKIGMLANGPVLLAVARWLSMYRSKVADLPVVLDPVLRSSSGHELLEPDAVALLKRELLPLVSVVTPNLVEAAQLGGLSANTREAVPEAARALQKHMLHRGGAVVVTGGHFDQHGTPDDFLLESGSAGGMWFPGSWVHTRATHGTGCAFSSALLCNLVHGLDLPGAVQAAKVYVHTALEAAYPVGHGRGPMHHLFAFHPAAKPNTAG